MQREPRRLRRLAQLSSRVCPIFVFLSMLFACGGSTTSVTKATVGKDENFVIDQSSTTATQSSESAAALTYAQVKPILEANCTTCHDGTVANPSLTTLNAVTEKRTQTIAALEAGTMPPSGKFNGVNDKADLLNWLKNGKEFAAVVASPAKLPLRRLTNQQYLSAVQQTLGVDVSDIVKAFQSESTIGGEIVFKVANSPDETNVQDFMNAAETIASRAVARGLSNYTSCAANSTNNACVSQFLTRFGKLLFRRPLSNAELTRLELGLSKEVPSGAVGEKIELALVRLLQAPQFLYVLEAPAVAGNAGRKLNAYEVATRLSLFLLDAPPDEALLAKAANGELDTPESIRAVAGALLNSSRGRVAFRQFFGRWLDFDGIVNRTRDTATSPRFYPELLPLMLKEGEMLTDSIFWGEKSDLREIFLAKYSFINEDLANIYGVPGVTGPAFRRVTLPLGVRSGFLTTPVAIASHTRGERGETNPIFSGKFVRDQILCQKLGQPPKLPADALTKLATFKGTLRERFNAHGTQAACVGCHSRMDEIGFSFEEFNDLGVFKGPGAVPVAAGNLLGVPDIANPAFRGPVQLSEMLASSATVQNCFVKQVFRYALRRMESAGEAEKLKLLTQAFASKNFNMRELMLDLAMSNVIGELPNN